MKYENHQALVPNPKADHKAAQEWARKVQVSAESQNLAAAYLERDQELRELRELAKDALDGNKNDWQALRAKIEEIGEE